MSEFKWVGGVQNLTPARPFSLYLIRMRYVLFLFIITISLNGSLYAQNSKSRPLSRPIVMATVGSFDARMASRGGVAVYITHSKNDTISGFRYARWFANGFTDSTATGGKPIYVTATYNENTENDQTVYKGSTFVEFFVNGGKWFYKGQGEFEPYYASRLVLFVMNDYVKESGYSRILPKDTKPILIQPFN